MLCSERSDDSRCEIEANASATDSLDLELEPDSDRAAEMDFCKLEDCSLALPELELELELEPLDDCDRD